MKKRRPLYIPLKANRYVENLEGKLINFCQLIEEDGKLKVRLVKEIEDRKDRYIPVIERIGIDVGLRPLIATSEGDLIGRNFSLSF